MALSHKRSTPDEVFLARVGALIAACTAALTLSFFGLVAFMTGSTPGASGRIPLYVLGMALVFVGGIVIIEQRPDRSDGREVLVAAGTLGVVSLVFFTLAGEGLMYAARNPDQALASRRFLYLVAAGLIGTGVGYWGLHHREDVVRALR